MTSPLIIVIDDSSTIRRSAEIFLKQAGYEVSCFESGFDAISALNDLSPVLIFLDVMMEGLDGYQVCRLIKSHPRVSRIPLVILSSKGGHSGEAHAKLSGADGLLTKPFTKQSLLDTVDKYVKGKTAAVA